MKIERKAIPCRQNDAFGPLHNLTTRRVKIVKEESEEDEKKKKGMIERVKSIFRKKIGKEETKKD